MGFDAVLQVYLVPGQQNFPDDIAILSKMSAHWLYPDVVETVKTVVPIILDDPVPDVVKTKSDVPGGDYLIGPDMGHDMPDQFQRRCLSASHGAGKQNALFRVDAELFTGPEILDQINAQSVNDIKVFLPDMELVPEQQFALGVEIIEDFHEIVFHLFAVEFP